MIQTRRSCAAMTRLAGALVLMGLAPLAAAQSDTYFRDLSGANTQSNGIGNFDGLTDIALSMGRSSLEWRDVQSSAGAGYDDTVIDDWIQVHYTGNATHNASSLFGFTYAEGWPEDESNRSWEYMGVTYTISNGRLTSSDGRFNDELEVHGNHNWHSGPQPQYKDQWADYVSHTTNRLVNAGGEYFQIWNEPAGKPAFYVGDMDQPGYGGDSDAAPTAVDTDNNFYNLVHKPAADAIHNAGGKVVFGGWPTGSSVNAYIDWLDYHSTPNPADGQDAWDTIDVMDVHYRSLAAMEQMRQAAEDRGYGDIGIWQTEVSNNRFEEYIPSFYPRFAKWALEHNDGDPDRYRAFFFPYAGAGKSIDNYSSTYNDRNLLLVVTDPSDHDPDHALTENGIALKTVGQLLSGDDGQTPLKLYEGSVRNSEGITFNLNDVNNAKDTTAGTSSTESFQVGDDKIVVAMHLDSTETTGDIQVYFDDIDPDNIDFADRVTPYGDRIDLMDTLEELANGGVAFTVPTDGIDLPAGGTLNSIERYPRTFFVQLGLVNPLPVPEPTSAAVLLIGIGGLLSRRRR